MPTYRKLHTKTLDSTDFNDMPDDFTRVFWLLLPLRCDREGRAIDDPHWIRSSLFPRRRDVTIEQIEAAIEWLSARGMIIRYKVGNESCFHIVSWGKYQTGTEREAPSFLPSPLGATIKEVTTNSGVSQACVKHADTVPVYVPVPVPVPEEAKEKVKKSAPKKSEPKAELLVTSIPHGDDLQAVLDKHFSGLPRPIPAWASFSSTTQRDAYAAAATVLDDEFVNLATVGLSRNRSKREDLLGWLQGCVRNKGNGSYRGNTKPVKAGPEPFDPTRPRVIPHGQEGN